MRRNIENTDSLRRKLRQLREAGLLTKADLADKAGVSERTVREIETDGRERIQEKTLMLLAQALDVTLDELLERSPQAKADKPRAGYRLERLQVFLVIGLVAAGCMAMMLWEHARNTATWEVTEKLIIGRDGVFGIELWRLVFDTDLLEVRLDPWGGDFLLVIEKGDRTAEIPLIAIDRRTGKRIWELFADRELIADAFGEDVLAIGVMRAKAVAFGDLDGDGNAEAVCKFQHSKFYPALMIAADSNGRALHSYALKGHVRDFVLSDIDNDGRDECIVAGYYTAPIHEGAMVTILDDDHFLGASVDSQVNPESAVSDGCLVRAVFPKYPSYIQSLMGEDCLFARGIQITDNIESRGAVITVDIQAILDKSYVIVEMDKNLNVIDTQLSDSFRYLMRTAWPDSAKVLGLLDDDWRNAWASSHYRFGAVK